MTNLRIKWDADQLFREYGHEGHHCCSCCVGFCPQWEGGWHEPSDLLTVADRYVSDRFVAIDKDLIAIDHLAEKARPQPGPKSLPKSMTVPDPLPGQESTATFTPSIIAPLLHLGIDIREAGPGKAQHLVFQDRHIGFVMAFGDALNGPTISQVRVLARMLDSHNLAYPQATGIAERMVANEYPIDNLWTLIANADEIARAAAEVREARS